MTHIRIDPHNCLSPEARAEKARRIAYHRTVLLWVCLVSLAFLIGLLTGPWVWIGN